MNAIPVWRRFAIAAVTLVLASGLFRPQLASALIMRGDDAIRNGDRASAIRYYGRAIAVDAGSATAADRLAFSLCLRRVPRDAQAAIDIATSALRRAPDNASLLADRALAEQVLRRWPRAELDFARAAHVARDPRYDHFAGRIALVRGDITAARQYFRAALAYDEHFSPARAALGRLR